MRSGSSSGSHRSTAERRARLVLLDTNALFLPVRTGFPLELEIDRLLPGATLRVLTSTLRELDRLVARSTPDATAARALAGRYRTVATSGRGDDAVVAAAGRLGAAVVTADRGLRQRLTAAGNMVLYPRDRHRLEPFSPKNRSESPREPRRARHR